jgi:hypothetical protein
MHSLAVFHGVVLTRRNIFTFTSPFVWCPFYCVTEHGIFIAQNACIYSDIPWQIPHSGMQQQGALITVRGFSEDIVCFQWVGTEFVYTV